MSRAVPHGPALSKGAFTLIEVTAAVVAITIVLSMVMGGYSLRIQKARLEQTVHEMMSLAQASLDFYNARGAWPAAPSDLSSVYMYATIQFSPFGDQYQINGINGAVTVSTAVPSGVGEHFYQGTLLQIVPGGAEDTISITQRLPNEFTGRLQYEKKYTYKQ